MKDFLKRHYCWIIAFVMLIEMAIYGGLINNQSGLYIIPVSEALGSTRGEFSLAITVCNIVGFFGVMFSGALINRFGNRVMLTAGLIVHSIAYVIFFCSQNIAAIAIGSAVLGLGTGFVSSPAASRVIGDWFHRYQGTVLGIVTASTGIGGAIFSITLSHIIETKGWRASYLTSAFLFFAVALLIFVLIRNKPSDIGLTPYGTGEVTNKEKATNPKNHWEGFTMRQLVRRPCFYLMLLVTLLSCMAMHLAFSQVLPHLRDQGLNASEAATLQSAMMIILAVAKVFVGILSDKIGPKWVMIITLICLASGLWLLSIATNFVSALIAVFLFSLGIPVNTIMPPLLSYSLFGYQSYNASLGIVASMVTLSSLVSSPISNFACDYLGSYSPVFQFAAVLSVVVMILYTLLYAMVAKDRKKLEQTV